MSADSEIKNDSTPPTETFEAIYNMAIDQILELVKTHYIYGHTVVNGVMDSLYKNIEQLKKK